MAEKSNFLSDFLEGQRQELVSLELELNHLATIGVLSRESYMKRHQKLRQLNSKLRQLDTMAASHVHRQNQFLDWQSHLPQLGLCNRIELGLIESYLASRKSQLVHQLKQIRRSQSAVRGVITGRAAAIVTRFRLSRMRRAMNQLAISKTKQQQANNDLKSLGEMLRKRLKGWTGFQSTDPVRSVMSLYERFEQLNQKLSGLRLKGHKAKSQKTWLEKIVRFHRERVKNYLPVLGDRSRGGKRK